MVSQEAQPEKFTDTAAPAWGAERLVTPLVLGGALVVGGFLRTAGLSFRLPAVHHPDEEAILHQALRFGTSLMHGQLGEKITLYGLALLASCMVFLVALRLTGRVGSLSGFETYFFENGGSFLLLGRMISVLASTATIWATYRLGRELVDRRLGLMAAVLVALSPVAVTEAHYLKLDSSVCLLIVLALTELVRQLRAPTRWGWLRIGIAMGLAAATHVNGLVLLPLPALVLFLERRTAGARTSPVPERADRGLDLRRLLGCYAVFAACFLLLTFRLVAPLFRSASAPAEKYHLEALVSNLQGNADRLTTVFGSISAYLGFLLPRFVGLAAFALVGAGLGLVVFSREMRALRRLFLPVIVFAGLYLVGLLPFPFRAERYALPLLPVMALLAALAVHFILSLKTARPALAPAAAGALMLLAAAQPAYGSIRAAYEFSSVKDTRDLARAWVESNIPQGTTLAIEAFHRLPTFTLQVNEDMEESRYKLERTLALNLGTGKIRKFSLARQPYPLPNYPVVDLTGDELIFPEYENPYDLGALRLKGVKYVVLSSEIESLYDSPADRATKAQVISDILTMPNAEQVARVRNLFVSELRRSGATVTTFGPAQPWRLRGPQLTVYSLDQK